MADIDGQTSGLIINLLVGIITLIVCLLSFDFFRRKVPSVFEARRALNIRRINLDYFGGRVYSPQPPTNRQFGWLIPVCRLKLEDIANSHGLDTALYLRYLRTMASLFLVLCIPAAILLPIYYTGANKNLPEGDQFRTLGIQTFSLSNVDKDDNWRFWPTLGAEFVVLAFVSSMLITEFSIYTKERRRYRSSVNPSNYAVLVQDIPRQSCNEDAVYGYWNKLFPGEIAEVYFIHDGKLLFEKKDEFWHAVTKRERAEWEKKHNQKLDGNNPTHKVGTCTCCKGDSARTDSIKYWSDQQDNLANTISSYQREIDKTHTPPTRAAIVVFNNRRAAAVASQTSFSTTENEWRVSHAPEPKAMNWKAMSIPSKQIPIRSSLTILFSILLTLFWIIPVTIIMGLVNLEELAKVEISSSTPFSFLEGVADWSPVATGLIQSFLPAIILSVFLSLIPTFLRIFINISRVPSNAKVDNLVRDWYFNFVIFSNFLFVIVAGSLLNKLQEIIEEPSSVIDFLAQSAPKQAGFMMNFILLKALTETPKNILQIGRVGVRWVMLKYFARTTREKNKVDTGNTIFTFFRSYAIAQLVTVLGIIYSTVAPLIIPICFAYFFVMYLVEKYNLCFSMYNPYEDGGSMYGGALYGLWIALFLHLLTIAGILGLNKNPAQTALVAIPIILSIVVLIMCRKKYSRITSHGSGLETQLRVDEEDGVDTITAELAATYAHPAFEPLPDVVENLNGVDNVDDEDKMDIEAVHLEGADPVDTIHAADRLLPTPPDDDVVSGQRRDPMSAEDWRDAYSAGHLKDSGIGR